MQPKGPAWLGIGAQRSGTTWLTDLLVQHPDVGLGTNGKKEQHALQRIARGALDERDYADLFPDDGLHRGDFTPRYLNNATVPAVAARVVSPDAPVVAVLRDPVERFASALRRRATQQRSVWPYEAALAYAQWTGMYAAQLDLWESTIGRDRMLVFTYEAVRDDPATVCGEVWGRLGLAPVEVRGADEPSGSSAGHAEWEWPDGLRDSLVRLYAPQLDVLADRWSVRTDLWSSFAATAA